MSKSPEKNSPEIIKGKVDRLLGGKEFVEFVQNDKTGYPLPISLSLAEVKLLYPDFPDDVGWLDLQWSIDERNQPKQSRLGRLVFRILDAFDNDGGSRRDLNVSSRFAKLTRSISGNPIGVSPWVWLEVNETRLQGLISVDGVEFSFDDEMPIIRASSNWLNSDGRDVAKGITYTYIPSLDTTYTSMPQGEVANSSIHFVDRYAAPIDNLNSILDQAANISIPY